MILLILIIAIKMATNIYNVLMKPMKKIMFNIAYSCSKPLAYGMRVGANIILSKNKQAVENAFNAFTRSCLSLLE